MWKYKERTETVGQSISLYMWKLDGLGSECGNQYT